MIEPPAVGHYQENMRNFTALIPYMALLYHESSRPSVAAGDTLAHAHGQAKPFTEYPDLRTEARNGRRMTAENLLGRYDFELRLAPTPAKEIDDKAIETLARGIHEAERDAIERKWTVVQLDPPQPWITFDKLDDRAKAGRRRQARWFLERFGVFDVHTGKHLGSPAAAPASTAKPSPDAEMPADPTEG